MGPSQALRSWSCLLFQEDEWAASRLTLEGSVPLPEAFAWQLWLPENLLGS